MATIFIVDDEPMLHELYSDILMINGHRVVANAYDGDQAVNIFKTMIIQPDFIIMDHRMPNKNGIETIKELVKIQKHIKIIFASADNSVMNEALESGAYCFISKPFTVTDLLGSIGR